MLIYAYLPLFCKGFKRILFKNAVIAFIQIIKNFFVEDKKSRAYPILYEGLFLELRDAVIVVKLQRPKL